MVRIIIGAWLISLWLPTIARVEPVSVEDLVRQAFTQHPAVEQAASVYAEARGQRLTELAPPTPHLALEYEGIPDGSGLSEYEERRLSISQEIDFPLKYYWKNRLTNNQMNQAQYESLGILMDLESAVREAFVTAWVTAEKVKIWQEQANLSETSSRHLDRLVELGERAPLEGRQVQVEALRIQAELTSHLNQRQTALARLAQLTGLEPGQIELKSPLISDSIKFQGPWQASQITDNPDFNANRMGIQIAQNDQRQALFNWLPDLEFSYFLQRVSAEELPDYWGVELGLSIPVWFWWRNRGELNSAKARTRRAQADLAQLKIELTTELEQAVQSLEALTEQFSLFEDRLRPLAVETFELALSSYQLGEASYLQVLEAQRSRLAIESEYLEISEQILRARINLNSLTGRSILKPSELNSIIMGK